MNFRDMARTYEGNPKEKVRHLVSGRRIEYDAGQCFGDTPHTLSGNWSSYTDGKGATMLLNRCSRCEKLLEKIEIGNEREESTASDD